MVKTMLKIELLVPNMAPAPMLLVFPITQPNRPFLWAVTVWKSVIFQT